jgi:putative ABC transport system substrate-binding protein
MSTIRRREFISVLGAAAAWPLTAHGQQSGKVWRIGLISGGSRASTFNIVAGFPQGMRDLGYVEGKDFIMEYRFAEGNYERIPGVAAELIQSKVDIFVLATGAAIRPVQQATSTIPIIMGYSTDPVGNGFVASLARPGGNTTGLAASGDDTAPKQLELLTTIVLNLSRIGFLANPGNPNSSTLLASAQAAARIAGLVILPAEARNRADIQSAFATFAGERVGAIMVPADATFLVHRQRIAELAIQSRLPSMFVNREYVEAGGLMSYGENLKDFFRRAAIFVDKIFKGAKPGDLPVEQPTKFNLVINRKTADTLGVAIPPQLYIFADEVIE